MSHAQLVINGEGGVGERNSTGSNPYFYDEVGLKYEAFRVEIKNVLLYWFNP